MAVVSLAKAAAPSVPAWGEPAEPRALVLGGEIARGGEGSVHAVVGEPGLLAKVWHEPDPAKAVKISVMTAHPAAEALDAVAAWPLFPVTLPGAGVRGFAMRRVEGHHGLHVLYTPKSRRSAFPAARWPFLARAALNLARSFEAVHAAGLVAGDINHSSVLVDRRATVTLIDCDSFQVETEARTFTCDVGVDAYTPPELQGSTLAGVVRTQAHDGFGLAVLVFQLLFLGRHPFSGVFGGRGEMTVTRAISECRFAYLGTRQMSPPPGALPLGCVGDGLASLFDRAFSTEASAGLAARPTAREWSDALSAFETSLVPCAEDPDHHRVDGAPCPFCALEAATGSPVFSSPDAVPVVPVPDDGPALRRIKGLPAKASDDVVRRIERILAKGGRAEVPALARGKGMAVMAFARGVEPVRWVALLAAVTLGMPQVPLVPDLAFWLSGCLAFFWLPRQTGRFARWAARREILEARARLDDLNAAMSGHPGAGRYDALAAEARRHGKALAGLGEERRELTGGLAANLPEWLGSHPVEEAGIEGLGPTRLEALSASGIATAREVTASSVSRVEGIGPVLADRLLRWRSSVEGRYRALLATPAARSRLAAGLVRFAQRKGQVLAEAERAISRAEAELAALRTRDAAFVEAVAPTYAAWTAARDERDAVLSGFKAST